MNSILLKVQKIVKYIKMRTLIKSGERIFNNEVKYLFLPKDNDDLLVVFSGFAGEKRRYNYISFFSNLNINQLYILDTWGNRGSYYWLDAGSDKPEKNIHNLIDYIIENNNLKKLIMAGSSKGGTAAIYYGLYHGANQIFAGANQFLVGDYLNRRENLQILEGMIGNYNKDMMVKYLNDKLANIISEHPDNKGIHLLYSKKELTYQRQIIPMKKCLDENNIIYNETIMNFLDHSEIGIYFPIFVLNELNIYK